MWIKNYLLNILFSYWLVGNNLNNNFPNNGLVSIRYHLRRKRARLQIITFVYLTYIIYNCLVKMFKLCMRHTAPIFRRRLCSNLFSVANYYTFRIQYSNAIKNRFKTFMLWWQDDPDFNLKLFKEGAKQVIIMTNIVINEPESFKIENIQ